MLGLAGFCQQILNHQKFCLQWHWIRKGSASFFRTLLSASVKIRNCKRVRQRKNGPVYTDYEVFFKRLGTKHFFKYGLKWIQENCFIIYFFLSFTSRYVTSCHSWWVVVLLTSFMHGFSIGFIVRGIMSIFFGSLVSSITWQCTTNWGDNLLLQSTSRDFRRFNHYDNVTLSIAWSVQRIKCLVIGFCCLWWIYLSYEHQNTTMDRLFHSTSGSPSNSSLV